MSGLLSEKVMSAIADRDPVLALRIGESETREPQILIAQCTFVNGTIDTTEYATLPTTAPEDYYITDAAFMLETPDANAGSLWKGQQDEFNALNSNIWARANITGGVWQPQYLVSQILAPVNGTFRYVNSPVGGTCSEACGWTLHYAQNIQIECILKRTYLTSTGELPARLSFFLRSMRLGCNVNWNPSPDEVIAGLEGLGIPVSKRAISRLRGR